MRLIADYRKLLGVDKTTDLKELKSVYRNLMKEWHPDKFIGDDARKLEAEEKSKVFIEAYTFLASISKETLDSYLPEYTNTVSNARITEHNFKSKVLEINFSDGSRYEYFDVPYNVYSKLVNSDIPGRFFRRNIYKIFMYRKVGNPGSE